MFSLFTRVVSGSAAARWFRREVVSRVLPRVLGSRRLRASAFRFISELRIGYRRSPAVAEGEPKLRAGPRAGDRLPDARITRGGRSTWLQRELAGPRLHLLLCGDPDAWDGSRVADLSTRYAGLVAIHRLSRGEGGEDDLVDASGEAFERLGMADAAQYLVRPDGYVGFRCAGSHLDGVERYLAEWFPKGVVMEPAGTLTA